MGALMEETAQISSTNVTNSENIGEAAIILIAIGSMLVILCAATIIYSLRRRRHVAGGLTPATVESFQNPTDFMNSLATWDSCHSIDEMLEKKRRSVWSLDTFNNIASSGKRNETKSHFET